MAGKCLEIRLWRDSAIRSAVEQMAVDADLLESEIPVIRFYTWAVPAVTYGYFVPEAQVAESYPGIEIARRRTGGGIVEHGDDVTFALAVPRDALAAVSKGDHPLKAPAPERYRWIHERLAAALKSCGIPAAIATTVENAADSRCFSGSVLSDVIDPGSGRKIAGGAQRRTRRGWLHQGSVRLDPPHDRIDAAWIEAFCAELTG